MQTKESICIGCSIECGVTVYSKDNQLVKIDGDWKAQPNNGLLCQTGRFIPLDEQRERLATPLVRKDGQLTPASWEEAASVVAEHLSTSAAGKQNGIAGLVSTRLPLEAIYHAKELFRTALNSAVTCLDEGKYTSLTKQLDRKLGDAGHNKLEDIENADLIVLLNADLATEHQVASFLVKRSVAFGAKLLVIGSAENALESIAELSLRVNPKVKTTDILDGLTAALQKVGLDKTNANGSENGALDHAALSTAIPVESYLKAAKLLGSADKPLIIYGNEKTDEEAARLADKIICFAQASGAMQSNWTGLLSMKGKANSYAAALYDLDQPISIGSNQTVYVAIGDEEPTQSLLNLVEKKKFLVVQAAYRSKLTGMADVVLPTSIWGEEQGHYLNINGEIKISAAFRTAAPLVKSNYEILNLLAGHMNIQDSLEQDWQAALKNASVKSVA